MATTNTYAYNPDGETLISEALRILGVLEEGGSASTAQIEDSLPAFEMYLKGLSKYGLNIWTTVTEPITLTASDGDYTSSSDYSEKFLKITDAVFRDSDGEDTTLIPLTRQEYWNLSDKDQTGQPTQFYFDYQGYTGGDASIIYLWPVPDSSNAGSGETIQITGQVLFEDVSSATNTATETLDVPQEWLETIKYGLATRLAPMYGYPIQERSLLLREYNDMLQESLAWDTEQESIYFQPDYDKAVI